MLTKANMPKPNDPLTDKMDESNPAPNIEAMPTHNIRVTNPPTTSIAWQIIKSANGKKAAISLRFFPRFQQMTSSTRRR